MNILYVSFCALCNSQECCSHGGTNVFLSGLNQYKAADIVSCAIVGFPGYTHYLHKDTTH